MKKLVSPSCLVFEFCGRGYWNVCAGCGMLNKVDCLGFCRRKRRRV